jgi:murein L,D-transpeptidase YcbB/YkuD
MKQSVAIRGALLLILCALAVTGCRKRDVPETAAALQAVLAGGMVAPDGPHDQAVWKDVRAFYALRDGNPAWVTHLSISKRAAAALEALRAAPAHGLVAADYGEPQIAKLVDGLERGAANAPDRLQQLANADVRLTTALLALGRDVAIGRTSPQRIDGRWKARRTAPDLAGTLNRAAENDLKEWTASISPQHPEYASLEKALTGLRQRLASEPAAKSSAGYDMRTPAGIRAFQEHYGLKATGIADAATMAAANVPIASRIRQIELNLERWRWMPDDLGARHLMVNIPLYQVLVRENGKTVQDIRVVVGKLEHETPIFSGEMTTVIFSPYWNIPDSIVEGETAPAVARDPNYLAKHHIEILRVTPSGPTPIQPSDANWDDPEELRQLAFRQLPGPDNALGHVKFVFPNEYNVYLHDSPADELFARPGRAFSHGCVRVEEPETLAQYVLRDDPAWPMPKILAAMNSGVETPVTLKQPLPVHIVYFTAWVDAKGGLHFQPDVYGYDAKQDARK